MIYLKSAEEIELIRQAALLVSKTLGMLAKEVVPGAVPLQLDKKAEEFIRDHGGVPAFLGLYNFPNTLCISINEVVVHGIPGTKPLKEGDIVSIDCGVKLNGYMGDHAYTFMVGEVSPEVKKLLKITLESLYLGIDQCKAGNRIGDIGYAIQTHTEAHGYGVVRELVGHGLGRQLHEEPQVPNYGKRGKGKKIEDGLVIAIEPMINLGTHRVRQLKDGWSIVTADGKPSAHFEHNVAVLNGKPEILSTFNFIYEALGGNPLEYFVY
ncbi:methionine aminopeptidase [Thermaurantimonas aggregans]|uniref:Methionine aminopeptidase n=1 Tax=Thermaurantimonas aggregans TaxID=2173829 RepID=A0A401XMA7_9FLAO|nr:type I methionyl aminopeptidase [Thermaurantimonas aggregans]MCX8147746.1 type I methionyl aminopeptidase [Thermaurantimonas aggregans]GCD78150.1 methionine aminopeptidase [Thermaurantimonas aggregans]